VLSRFILAGAAAFHWLSVRLFGISYREWISGVYERCVGGVGILQISRMESLRD
jgi:hypothetical protein